VDGVIAVAWWALVAGALFGAFCGLMAFLSGGPQGVILILWAAGLLWWLWWLRWGS
jgi:hypothetical protein